MYNLPISNIAVGSFELNRKLKTARRNGFNFNQIIKLTIKLHAKQSQRTIH